MDKLTKTGQVFFGISIAGLGLQQFVDSRFRPVIIPEWPSWIPGMTFWVYLTGAAMVVAGLAIVAGWKGKKVSLYTGVLLLLFLLVFHLPYRFNHSPEILGAWTDDLKILALAGGAFVAAMTFRGALSRSIDKLLPYGRIFFSVMLIVFGIDHFLYVQFVKTLVPSWIPGALFWSYFAAVALIGSGLAILFNIKTRPVAILLGIMLFLWVLLLHIPRAYTFPYMPDKGNEMTSVLEALGFSGVAFMIAGQYHKVRSMKL